MPRLSSILVLAALGLWAPSAVAFTGEAPVRFAPGTRGEPIAHPAVQRRLDRSPAWVDFLERRGPWTARWNEATRVPAQLWGRGVDVDAAALLDDDRAWSLGFGLLEEDAAVLGIAAEDLQPWTLDRGADMTVLTFARTHRGLPVVDARVSLRFAHGRFVMAQYDAMPGVAEQVGSVEPQLSRDEAVAAALAELPGSWDVLGVELVILPLLSEDAARYRLAWQVEIADPGQASHRLVWIDARGGALLRWGEQVRHAQASLRMLRDDRYPQLGQVEEPLAYGQLDAGESSWEADPFGVFDYDIAEDTAVTLQPGSRWFAIQDQAATDFSMDAILSPDGVDLLLAPAEDASGTTRTRQMALLDVHAAAHEARSRVRRINPMFGWAVQRVTAKVNIDDGTGCNAYFDGAINFLRQSAQCNNTGRIADVVHHEYGHGFHAYSIVQGAGAFDGALSEGLSDYLVATISGDPATARGFYRNNTGPLRDIAEDHVWPDDIGEIHFTGIIIAGALWDLREALVDTYGEEEGVALADKLYWNVARLSTDIPDAYADVLLADDDNGDLSDGTPDQCLIDEAFGRHGLGPAADSSQLFAIDHEPPSQVAADQEIILSMNVQLARPRCTEGEVGSVVVSWALDDDPLEPLTISGGGDVQAVLPAAPSGSLLRYRIEVLSSTGEVLGVAPRGSITDPWYGVDVGGLEEFYFEDFEGSDGGYISELISGDPQREGADDWGWGSPKGQSGDPVGCWSGDSCWGNDISPQDSWNGAYQRNVHNALRSPRIEVGDVSELHLEFRRWLTVEDGVFDEAIVRVNGETIWQQFSSGSAAGGQHHVDTYWALRSYDITDLVVDGAVEIDWELVSDEGLQMGGWNIDDVRLVGRTAPPIPADSTPSDGLVAGDGCSACSATGGRGSLGLLLLPLLLLARRRSRGSAITGI